MDEDSDEPYIVTAPVTPATTHASVGQKTIQRTLLAVMQLNAFCPSGFHLRISLCRDQVGAGRRSGIRWQSRVAALTHIRVTRQVLLFSHLVRSPFCRCTLYARVLDTMLRHYAGERAMRNPFLLYWRCQPLSSPWLCSEDHELHRRKKFGIRQLLLCVQDQAGNCHEPQCARTLPNTDVVSQYCYFHSAEGDIRPHPSSR